MTGILESIARSRGTDKAAHGYMPHYERHIPGDFSGKLLEIGIDAGASLRTWRDYWPTAEGYRVDIPARGGGLRARHPGRDDDHRRARHHHVAGRHGHPRRLPIPGLRRGD